MASKRMKCRVTGMACTGCAAGIERGIAMLDGVESVKADFESGRAAIIYDPELINQDSLADAIRDLGYEVNEISSE